MSDPAAADALASSARARVWRRRWTRLDRGAREVAAALRPAVLLRLLSAEQDRWFLWLPVLLGVGIGGYFVLPSEPAVVVGLGGLAITLGFWLTQPAGLGERLLAGGLLPIALGFAAVQMRASLVAAPVLERSHGPAIVTGWIDEIEQRGNATYRVSLRVVAIEGLVQAVPRRVRLRVQGASETLRIGAPVRVAARLTPPPLPALPGDYDFARRAYFQGLGAVGSARSSLQAAPEIGSAPWQIAIWAPGENLRRIVAERIALVLGGDRGAITTALIQGDQGGISEATMLAMRESGLAHILSISGLHMAIVAGALFWTVRALLALSTLVAQRLPVRPLAAVLACAGALFYLMLSGWQVPAVRSFVMLAIMFLAIVLARPAISLRNVALAALLLLLVRPENLLDVSFLMSFAATTGLVTLYETLAERRRADLDPREPAGVMRRGLRLIGADILTTLVAGLSVAPLGAYFFHTIQNYSVLANLLALPIVSLVLMPLVLVVLVVMPLGLEALPLQGMAYGVDALMIVARWVAGLPGATTAIPAMPAAAVVLMMLGALWLALWRQPWRWLGLVLIGVGCWKSLDRERPDVLIGRDAETVAVRLADGRLVPLPARRSSAYEIARWLEHDGDRRSAVATSSVDPAIRCDAIGCSVQVQGLLVAHATEAKAAQATCIAADVVILRFEKGTHCIEAKIVIDRASARSGGPHQVHIRAGSVRVSALADYRGARPWATAPEQPRPVDGAKQSKSLPPRAAEQGADRW